MRKYVSIEDSRAGSAEKPATEPTPKTSATPAAKTNHGGQSASKNEEV